MEDLRFQADESQPHLQFLEGMLPAMFLLSHAFAVLQRSIAAHALRLAYDACSCCQQYLSKFDRRETQRYLQMFYHFKLRPLIQMVSRSRDEVCQVLGLLVSLCTCVSEPLLYRRSFLHTAQAADTGQDGCSAVESGRQERVCLSDRRSRCFTPRLSPSSACSMTCACDMGSGA
jgi:hypothetical protein